MDKLLGSYARAMLIYYPLCFAYLFIAFPAYAYISAGVDGLKALKDANLSADQLEPV